MALGFCPSILLDINDIAESNAPDRKMHIAGFLSTLFCLQDSLGNIVNEPTTDGHKKSATIKYFKRPLVSLVQSEDDCDINAVPAEDEWTLPTTSHKQVSFFIADETVRQYCKDASNMKTIGRTRVMDAVYGKFLAFANTLMKAVNQDVVAQMATEFGENVTNGDDGGTLINFNTEGDKNILNNGLIQMMRDIQENEFCGTPYLVGGGLWSAQNMAQALACCNAAGINFANANGLPTFVFDKDTQSIWGANSAGLFAPGSVKFISFDKYVGEAWSGQKGTSWFMNVGFPVNEFGCNLDSCLNDLRLDVQIRYRDCPGTETINGVNTTVGRGWIVTLSKDYALWVQPTTGYAAGDSLADTNGTIKYFASNTSYTGGSYSLY